MHIAEMSASWAVLCLVFVGVMCSAAGRPSRDVLADVLAAKLGATQVQTYVLSCNPDHASDVESALHLEGFRIVNEGREVEEPTMIVESTKPVTCEDIQKTIPGLTSCQALFQGGQTIFGTLDIQQVAAAPVQKRQPDEFCSRFCEAPGVDEQLVGCRKQPHDLVQCLYCQPSMKGCPRTQAKQRWRWIGDARDQ